MIGIIGGTGLENPDFLEDAKTITVRTPYGKTASPIRIGWVKGKKIAFVSRHGWKHQYAASQVPYKANVWALKKLGASEVFATTVCGSLRKNIKPGEFVIPSQLIDFAKFREQTFQRGIGLDDQTSFGEPFSKKMIQVLIETLKKLKFKYHANKTLITINGPHFSSRAESRMFQNWGADIINMTTATEAALFQELKIGYAVFGMVTDYDSWKQDRKPVTVQEIIRLVEKKKPDYLKVLHELILKVNDARIRP